MKLNEKIKHLRNLKNWTQVELAEKMEVTSSYIKILERGKSEPSSTVLKKLAQAFGVTSDYFLFDVNDVEPTNVAINDKELLRQFKELDSLSTEKLTGLKDVINNFLLGFKVTELTSKKGDN